MKVKTNPLSCLIVVLFCLAGFLLACSSPATNDDATSGSKDNPVLRGESGFSFDCDNTPRKPCRKLVASFQGKPPKLEPSGAVFSKRHKKVIVVNDNYDYLEEHNAAHYVIVYFDPRGDGPTIPVKPLLTPKQAADFPLYDLEGVTLHGDRLYATGSLSLHRKNRERDGWERNQFVQMDLEKSEGVDLLFAGNLSHFTRRWLDFRDWLLSESGYPWSVEEVQGRAEGKGINVEALSSTTAGTLLLGFRGPLASHGGALALEIRPPSSPEQEPVLVKKYEVRRLDSALVPKDSPRTLRGMAEIPGRPGKFYLLLGPQGQEKEQIILARWNANTARLEKDTPLPVGFVAEGITPIASDRLLIVDDLAAKILIATEN